MSLLIRDMFVLLRFRELPSNPKPTAPISVVVCAHNELINLQALIPILINQTYPNYEIVIALDRCTDGSLEYLKEVQSDLLKIVEIKEKPNDYSGKKYALTQAISQASHEWILLTDADCQPISSHWIETFGYQMDDQADLIIGVSPYAESKNLVGQLTSYETLMTAISYTTSTLRGKAYMGVGRNLAYRKSKFLAVQGYHPFNNVMGGDDDLLVQKLSTAQNTRLTIHPKSLTYSKPERTWKEYLSQKTRHLSVGKYYPVIKQISLSLKVLTHAVLWLSFLYLLQSSFDPKWFALIFGGVMIIKGVFLKKMAQKLGMTFSWKWFLFLDFGYALFLPITGLRASVVKNIKWN
ncbi:MAG: glycosyltransferase [Cyclobacteriaceae bacterium]